MSEKLLLLITDEDIVLFEGLTTKIYPLKKGLEHIQNDLEALLARSPKVPLRLVVDRNHQDIREEQLPPLLPWDRLRLLHHKREAWKSQGGFYGYRFFKQDGESYLQWIHILPNDVLASWLSWIRSLSHPFEGVFFTSLEGGTFLKMHCPTSVDFHMLIYKISSHQTRHVIFKGRRLLLVRALSGEEDLNASLHFLSRTYPDIHDKLYVLSLIKGTTDSQTLIDFLAVQRRPSISLNMTPLSKNLWVKRIVITSLISCLFLIGSVAYLGIQYKREVPTLLSHIAALKVHIQDRKILLKNKNVLKLRSALEHYVYIKSQRKNPFTAIKNLSLILEKHNLRLESLIWNAEETTHIEIVFFMQNHKGDILAKEFHAVLASLTDAFPQSEIHVIEGPLKSSPHETYTYPPDLGLPMAHIRIVRP